MTGSIGKTGKASLQCAACFAWINSLFTDRAAWRASALLAVLKTEPWNNLSLSLLYEFALWWWVPWLLYSTQCWKLFNSVAWAITAWCVEMLFHNFFFLSECLLKTTGAGSDSKLQAVWYEGRGSSPWFIISWNVRFYWAEWLGTPFLCGIPGS